MWGEDRYTNTEADAAAFEYERGAAEHDWPTASEIAEMNYRDMEDERYSRVATEGEAHAEWHRNTGERYGCPQDACHPPEDFEPEPGEGEGIRCGRCKGRHWTVADVRACYATR